MKYSISIAISALVLSSNAIAFAEPFKNNTVRSLLEPVAHDAKHAALRADRRKTTGGHPPAHRAGSLLISQDTNSTQVEGEIREFIDNWGEAWSPKENAPQYSRESLTPFYWQSEELLAFDFTDAKSQTVFKGVENHHDTWSAFVREYDYWTFTPVTKSIRIYPQSDNAAAATLYVDNYGIKPDGTEFEARAHATLLLEKRDGNWVIVHENIWGPVNE